MPVTHRSRMIRDIARDLAAKGRLTSDRLAERTFISRRHAVNVIAALRAEGAIMEIRRDKPARGRPMPVYGVAK